MNLDLLIDSVNSACTEARKQASCVNTNCILQCQIRTIEKNRE